MNIPKTRKPKRFSGAEISRRATGRSHEGGRYTYALLDETIALRLGELAACWPHVEERMIDFLHLLLDQGPSFPGRQIFRAIINQQTRIKVMRTLLERTEMNKDRNEEYDYILDEFAALNEKRNGYLHGLWVTHESGRVYISEAVVDDFFFLDQREVKAEELEQVITRMGALHRRVLELRFPGLKTPPSTKHLLRCPTKKAPRLAIRAVAVTDERVCARVDHLGGDFNSSGIERASLAMRHGRIGAGLHVCVANILPTAVFSCNLSSPESVSRPFAC